MLQEELAAARLLPGRLAGAEHHVLVNPDCPGALAHGVLPCLRPAERQGRQGPVRVDRAACLVHMAVGREPRVPAQRGVGFPDGGVALVAAVMMLELPPVSWTRTR